KMILHMSEIPDAPNLLPTESAPERTGKRLIESGMALTAIGAAATAFGAAWIGYEAANPTDGKPIAGSDPNVFNLGHALCDAFTGLRYFTPTVVVLSGAALGITGGVLWQRGAKRLADAKLFAGPGSVSLVLRW